MAKVVLSAADAIAAFAALCVERAPCFEDTVEDLARFGFTEWTASGTIYHSSRTGSLRFETVWAEAIGYVWRYSVVYDDIDRAAADKAVADLVDRLGGGDLPSRATSTTVGQTTRDGTLWEVEVDGRPAQLIYLPPSDAPHPGTLLIQIPRTE